MKAKLFVAMLSLTPVFPALSAPFCVEQTGLPLQCYYVDPAQCQREAIRQNGRCSANPSEIKSPSNAQAFCLVQAGGLQSCIYPDVADCQSDAARHGGACLASIPAPPPAPNPAPGTDMFAVKRPY